MKIKYYGTGAGSGIPDMFCSCRICEDARLNGGKNIRTRSQATVNDDLCIDFPVDSYMHAIYGGLDMRKIHHLLITHNHYDHFLHQNLSGRPYGANEPMNVYISEESSVTFAAGLKRQEEDFSSGKRIRTDQMKINLHTVKPFEPFEFLHYRVTPIPAHHGGSSLGALLYIIEDKDCGKVAFWGHDTGLMTKETKSFLKDDYNKKFDFVSLDCTLERGNCITGGHMDLNRCIETMDLFREYGRADEKTIAVISHIGHLVKHTHDEMTEEAASEGFIAAYDGMVVDVG